MEMVNAPTADGFPDPFFAGGSADSRDSALLVSASLVIFNGPEIRAPERCGLVRKKERPIVRPSQRELVLVQAEPERRFHFGSSFHPPKKECIRATSRAHVILKPLVRIHEIPQ